jgi:hypothetical protein
VITAVALGDLRLRRTGPKERREGEGDTAKSGLSWERADRADRAEGSGGGGCDGAEGVGGNERHTTEVERDEEGDGEGYE